MNRKLAKALGHETVGILGSGRYTSASGKAVHIRRLVERSVDGTVTYPAGTDAPPPAPGSGSGSGSARTSFAVCNETTLAAARRLVAAGHDVAALNFASAKHPGGGFLGGSRAQEESLARSSGLYATLKGNPMYAYHQQRKGGMYSDYAIYSPAVPVFRTDDGELLDEPWSCAFVTCPAVNAKVVLSREPGQRASIRAAMAERVHKVLAIAAHHGHDTYVLGAWGCGAFRNNGDDIADLFREALTRGGPFTGVFKHVVFAVIDWSKGHRFIGPFQRRFGALG